MNNLLRYILYLLNLWIPIKSVITDRYDSDLYVYAYRVVRIVYNILLGIIPKTYFRQFQNKIQNDLMSILVISISHNIFIR